MIDTQKTKLFNLQRALYEYIEASLPDYQKRKFDYQIKKEFCDNQILRIDNDIKELVE